MIPMHLIVLALVPTIWIVDAANGPGTNFTNLPPAVAAASNGDTILVRPGTYSAFSVSGKALTIRGAGAATATVHAAGSGYTNTTIDAVPAGTPFYLSGLSFVAIAPPWFQHYPGLRITGATTEAVLADVSGSGVPPPSNNWGNQGLEVSGGAVVHAARCTFTATAGYSSAGVFVTNGSRLAADACTFIGGPPGVIFLGGPVAGPGLYVADGFVTLSRCSVIGANAIPYGYGGHGVGAGSGSFARIAGNSGNVIKGGDGPGGTSYWGGDAIHVAPGGSAVVHGNPTLVGGVPSGSLTIGAVTLGAVPLPYLSLSGTTTGGGEFQAAQSVTLTLDGQLPNAPFALLVDLVPTFSSAYAPLTIGELLVPVPLVFPLEGTLNGAGMFQLPFTPAVSVPALLDVPLYAQAAVVDAVAGNVRLSNGWIRIFKP